MSENLDLVRSIYADWERGDWSRVDWADPEMELVFADGPMQGSWKGLLAVREEWREFLASWEDWGIAVEEYRELDEVRILLLVRNSGSGKASGVDVKQIAPQTVNVFHISDGNVTRFLAYSEVDRALRPLPGGVGDVTGEPGSCALDLCRAAARRLAQVALNGRKRRSKLLRCGLHDPGNGDARCPSRPRMRRAPSTVKPMIRFDPGA